MWENQLRIALNEQYNSIKKKNPRYSARSYANKLGLSPGTLSEIMRGTHKWKLTAERAMVIVRKMGLAKRKQDHLLALMGSAIEEKMNDFPPGNYEFLTDWIYAPVMMAFDLSASESRQPSSIAQRLGVSEDRIKQVISSLVHYNFLRVKENGEIQRTEVVWQAPLNTPAELILKSHNENLALAESALQKIPMEQRDFTLMTFVGNSKQLEVLKKEIRALYHKSVALMASENGNETIYRMSVQVFPVNHGLDV